MRFPHARLMGRAGPQFRLILVVSATSQFDIAGGRLAAIGVRDDMMERSGLLIRLHCGLADQESRNAAGQHAAFGGSP
jgi:hypothetical protein